MIFRLSLEQRIFFRSLCWQASWNFSRMQNMGLAYAIYPLLEQLYGHDRTLLIKKIKGYLTFFNTNPIMAAAVLGIHVNLEKNGQGEYGLLLARNLNSLYGAIGDAFFWNGIKPAMAALAVLVYYGGGGFWAPVALLLGYNIFHLGIRYLIYIQGVRHGLEVVNTIHHWQLPKVKMIVNYLTTGLLAFCVPYLISTLFPTAAGPVCLQPFSLFTAGIVAFFAWQIKQGVSIFRVLQYASLIVLAIMMLSHWLPFC